MRPVPLVVVCGQSIFLQAVEAALASLPGMIVMHYPLQVPLTAERLAALRPAVVVTEWTGGGTPSFLLTLLQAAIPLLMVDATRQRGHLLRPVEVELVGTSDMTGLLTTLCQINQI